MVYFHTKNPNLGLPTLEGLGMENVGIFYVVIHMYIKAIVHTLWPLCILKGHLVI
jgi:hypothetical protein